MIRVHDKSIWRVMISFTVNGNTEKFPVGKVIIIGKVSVSIQRVANKFHCKGKYGEISCRKRDYSWAIFPQLSNLCPLELSILIL